MKVTEWIPSPSTKQELVVNNEKERVEYRETENGMKKKRIIPKKVSDIWCLSAFYIKFSNFLNLNKICLNVYPFKE